MMEGGGELRSRFLQTEEEGREGKNRRGKKRRVDGLYRNLPTFFFSVVHDAGFTTFFVSVGKNPSLLHFFAVQEWWTEVRTKGHSDKKDEPWWPVLNTLENLIHVLTTIIWVASGHHAAVNFGQYHYAGYFPNRPTITRKNMPVEDQNSEDFAKFWEDPEFTLLQCFPSQIQATAVMAVLDILSSHAPDEEYLGEEPEPAWVEEPMIKAAFERFHGRMKEIEGIIDERNVNPKFKNRCNVGTVPYELLKPFSKPGVTGMGIPNSISI